MIATRPSLLKSPDLKVSYPSRENLEFKEAKPELQAQKFFPVRPTFFALPKLQPGDNENVTEPSIDRGLLSMRQQRKLLRRSAEKFDFSGKNTSFENQAAISKNQGFLDKRFTHPNIDSSLEKRKSWLGNLLGRMCACAIPKKAESEKSRKTIAIVGVGPSGLLAAKDLAEAFPRMDIELIDYQRAKQRKNNLIYDKDILKDVPVKTAERIVGFGQDLKNLNISSIKDIENKLRDYLKENCKSNVSFIEISEKLTSDAVKKLNADTVILATGANHTVPKKLGFSYTRRKLAKFDKPRSLTPLKDTTNFNVRIKVPEDIACQMAETIPKLSREKKAPFSYVSMKKGKNLTTFVITIPLLNPDRTSGIILSDEKEKTERCHDTLRQILGDDVYNEIDQNLISISSFDTRTKQFEKVAVSAKKRGRKHYYVIGDAKKTPFYAKGEGLCNAKNDIDSLVERLSSNGNSKRTPGMYGGARVERLCAPVCRVR